MHSQSVLSNADDDVDRPMRRLMYVSRATEPESWTAERLVGLGQESVRWNKPHSVTGFLLCSSPFFLQIIEGVPEEITTLHRMIFKDRRHTECTVVMDVPSDRRLYRDWDMRVEDMHAIALHPVTNSLLNQIVRCFVGMWVYLPKCAADLLLQCKNPSKEPPQKREVVVAFIHILHYKAILQQASLIPHLTDLLDAFVDVCVRNVERSGGSIAKFINGSCMAYWPVALATAAVAGIAQIFTDVKALREAEKEGSPIRLLHTAAGVHHGTALLCNAGTCRADFTLLGDMVNTAARVAALAVRLQSKLLLSSDIFELLAPTLQPQLEPMGSHHVQGRDQPVECYRLAGKTVEMESLKASIEAFGAGPCLAVPRATPGADAEDLPRVFRESRAAPNPIVLPRSLLSRKRSVDSGCPAPPSIRPACPPLFCLTYISWAEAQLGLDELEVIRSRGYAHNQRVDITSCLFSLKGLMAQTVEGPEAEVLALWGHIQDDRRHRDVVLVHKGHAASRTYHEPLALVLMTEDKLQAFPPVKDVLTQLARSFISLETYVPSIIVRHIIAGSDPRRLLPVQVDVVMLATDICSFTAISECCPLEGVWQLCTAFIDSCTAAIVAHEGEVIKLIGDCVTAYFPPKAAEKAVEASRSIVAQCEEMRKAHADTADCRAVLYCGVGLDLGPVVIAHNGSLQIRELTVTGEVSVRSQVVEALTRDAGHSVVVTEPVVRHLHESRRQFGRLPDSVPQPGVPCYGLLGDIWRLDRATITDSIREFRTEQLSLSGSFC